MPERKRSSLLMKARLRVGDEVPLDFVVRDVSSGGMKGAGIEGIENVEKGCEAEVLIGDADPIGCHIAWTAGNRFGVAFKKEIDPKSLRKTISGSYVRPVAPTGPEKKRLI